MSQGWTAPRESIDHQMTARNATAALWIARASCSGQHEQAAVVGVDAHEAQRARAVYLVAHEMLDPVSELGKRFTSS